MYIYTKLIQDNIKVEYSLCLNRWNNTALKDAQENQYEDILNIFKKNGYTT